MEIVNIWDLGERVSIKLNLSFYKEVKLRISKVFKTKREVYNIIKDDIKISFETFSNMMKSSYGEKFFTPLNIWVRLCRLFNIDLQVLQENIISYKTSNGPNYISNPVLPIKIVPEVDMIIAHNIADGTVINPKKNRLPYFGYRQYDPLFRRLYIKKLESIFGKINFPRDYYLNTTRPYCPPVLANLFFKIYDLNTKSFLSRKARIPEQILSKDKDYLMAVLIAFIIDEGSIDSTAIVIVLKNIDLTKDLFRICNKLGYKSTFKSSGDYGKLYILREGMRKFFLDYKEIIKSYPNMTLGKFELRIEKSFKIYNRQIYKSKGNRELILKILIDEDLTVNQIANRINMTRQGVRFHIHNLENQSLIFRDRLIGERNIVYSYRGR